ncbi:MAG: hypothetical protein Q8Q39_05815 [bacterium]|nr:hypothetical protein [bacterium]
MDNDRKKFVFAKLQALIRRRAGGRLMLHSGTIGSSAKGSKPQLHLYGVKEVQIGRRPAQQTYVAGTILHKRFAGFYLMPIYSHPKLLVGISKDLGKMLKGKSCFNITVLTPAIVKELEKLLNDGIAIYRREGWI